MTYSLVYGTSDSTETEDHYSGCYPDEQSLISVPTDASSMEEARRAHRLLAWELGMRERDVWIEDESDSGRFIDGDNDGDEVNVWSAWETPRGW